MCSTFLSWSNSDDLDHRFDGVGAGDGLEQLAGDAEAGDGERVGEPLA
jgi:hypothetical protein